MRHRLGVSFRSAVVRPSLLPRIGSLASSFLRERRGSVAVIVGASLSTLAPAADVALDHSGPSHTRLEHQDGVAGRAPLAGLYDSLDQR